MCFISAIKQSFSQRCSIFSESEILGTFDRQQIGRQSAARGAGHIRACTAARSLWLSSSVQQLKERKSFGDLKSLKAYGRVEGRRSTHS